MSNVEIFQNASIVLLVLMAVFPDKFFMKYKKDKL